MKLRSVILLVVPLFMAPAVNAADSPNVRRYPAHTISNSELRVLESKSSGRTYQLHVGLPGNYGRDTSKRYPVVYVTDGYWDFAKLTSIQGALVYDKVAPEFIIIGIGYPGENLDYGKMRTWELSPVPFGNTAESGHAADFLNTIKTEIIPFVESEYRCDPSNRVMAGASLGGLFTLFAMLTEPDLFQNYVAVTPAVVLGNDWLLGYEEAFVKTKRQLRGRLFVSGGGNESPGFLGGILRFNQRIQSRKYQGLAYEFRIIDGERHAGMQLESYNRGLRFVFAPLAAESGPSSSP